jgi:ubiquinone/menaquinone biosynthesis C-methylase UbiE
LDPPQASSIHRYYQSSDYISHTDSSDTFFDRCYQWVRKRAITGKRQLIQSFFSDSQGRLLDYGCGTGSFLVEMKRAGWQISGIENDSGAMQKASIQTDQLIHSPDHLVQFDSTSFEVLTLWHVLEHVHDLNETIHQFNRILIDNGILIIAVPNHTSYDANVYRKFWAAYDVPRHLYHFSPVTITRLLSNHGFKLISQRPMWFDSFYVSLLSEKYKGNTFGYLRAIFNGVISNLQALYKKDTCSSLIYIFRKTNSV